MIYHLPHDRPMSVLAFGRAVRVLAIATTADEANDAMRADPRLSCLAEIGPFVLLADMNDMGQLPGPKSIEKTAGVVARMLQRPARGGDWIIPAEATPAVDALRLGLGIIPKAPELPLDTGDTNLRSLLVEFDSRFGDAVEEDIEIDACDAVDWITEFAPRVRAALDGVA